MGTLRDELEQFCTEIKGKIEVLKGKEGNEATMRISIILPLLQKLGYDIFNPSELKAEHVPRNQVGQGKKPRVDFGILLEDREAIFIECKKAGENLDGCESQLEDYFNHSEGAIYGVLTNGAAYRIYKKNKKIHGKNQMRVTYDEIKDIRKVKESDLEKLMTLSKENVISNLLGE